MLFTPYEWTSAEQHQAVFKIRSEHHYDRDIAQVSGGFCKFQSTCLHLLVCTLSKNISKTALSMYISWASGKLVRNVATSHSLYRTTSVHCLFRYLR